ncbi:zinc finger BED domain-containing protein RICESLEEPER 2-like protein, partial [Tanacetum coccineum]
MSSIITCSDALNPCFNVSGVDYLIENISRDLEFQDDGFATRSLDWFHESFQGLYNMYYTKYGTNHTQSTSGGGSSSGVSRDPYARLLHGLKGHTKKKARNDPTMSSEYEQYLKADFVSHLHPKDFATFDVLGFWKAKENQFPVLSRMAMDILSVQASSVASESAFSTSGRLLTIRRTRLTPESLEMCMCLKDHLDAQERKQDTSPLELPLDVEEGVFNVEVQQNEATQLTDQEIALDASSDGSSGEPRHDYMMSSGAEDDQTGDGHDGSKSHGLTDLPLGGKRFTRMNNHGSQLSKLDRILVSRHFMDRWPTSNVLALPHEFPDHTPLLLSLYCDDYDPIPFKMFNSWLAHEDFSNALNSCWASTTCSNNMAVN